MLWDSCVAVLSTSIDFFVSFEVGMSVLIASVSGPCKIVTFKML